MLDFNKPLGTQLSPLLDDEQIQIAQGMVDSANYLLAYGLVTVKGHEVLLKKIHQRILSLKFEKEDPKPMTDNVQPSPTQAL